MKYNRDATMKVTVICASCGTRVETPHMTEDSARGYWNMKMADLEKKKKEAAVE